LENIVNFTKKNCSYKFYLIILNKIEIILYLNKVGDWGLGSGDWG